MSTKYDVIIIGSGIAGMTSAIYLKRAGLNIAIIEESAPGGQLNRSSTIENYPGYLNIDGPTLAFNIFSQVSALEVPYIYDSVLDIEIKGKDYIVKTKKEEIGTKVIVIATGRRPRKLGINNEEELIGRGISYCALCDGNLYKDKNIAIVGGGSSALEESLHLSNIVKKVTLIHRRDTFKAEKTIIEQVMKNKKIKKEMSTEIESIKKDKNGILNIELKNKKKIKVSGLFVSIGYVPNSEMFEKIEKDSGYIIVDSNGKTNLERVFACGDVIKKSTYQLTTASGEAANVANNIIKIFQNQLTNNVNKL